MALHKGFSPLKLSRIRQTAQARPESLGFDAGVGSANLSVREQRRLAPLDRQNKKGAVLRSVRTPQFTDREDEEEIKGPFNKLRNNCSSDDLRRSKSAGVARDDLTADSAQRKKRSCESGRNQRGFTSSLSVMMNK